MLVLLFELLDTLLQDFLGGNYSRLLRLRLRCCKRRRNGRLLGWLSGALRQRYWRRRLHGTLLVL
jgi:hypothetical protein